MGLQIGWGVSSRALLGTYTIVYGFAEGANFSSVCATLGSLCSSLLELLLEGAFRRYKDVVGFGVRSILGDGDGNG